jgi:hypothetical protein
VQVSVTAIKPAKMDPKVYTRALNKAVREYADTVLRKEFDSTQATFRKKFPIVVKDNSNRERVAWACIVEGEIYFYISEGTSIRWALMSSNWRSKTRPSPGGLKAGAGRGRVVIAGRRAMTARGIAPRPGIKGRKFPERIVRKLGVRSFKRGVDEAIEIASQDLFK